MFNKLLKINGEDMALPVISNLSDINQMIKRIQHAQSLDEVKTEISATGHELEKLLDDPSSLEADNALTLSFVRLDLLKQKGWITPEELRSSCGSVVSLSERVVEAKNSDEEKEEMRDFLKQRIAQLIKT